MSPQWLPHDLMLQQLETLDMCQSLFPMDDELVLSPSTASSLSTLRQYLDHSSSPASVVDDLATVLSFTLNMTVSIDQTDNSASRLSLTVSLPLTTADKTTYTIHQPDWLSRSQHATLSDKLTSYLNNDTKGDEPATVFELIEHVRQAGQEMYETIEHAKRQVNLQREQRDYSKDETEWRVWFVLTSLSTREKRQDMVDWAPSYGLTGVVLAGKPALLVLEGTSDNVDKYMSDIKSKSWSDVPSFQKKVSERFRSPISQQEPRAFQDMQEITHLISRGGHRGNRGDMVEVRDFLESKGLGDAFGTVLGNGTFA
ncbi:hypothetical protein ACM66B_002363 [Microbotryomycetes sp. NB124-2]